ncbi:hypothetical protein TURU_060054 [Turdus rufiventris]|nr:hypothetical protein TURU_060054 [Turdus rufiventris]
MLPCGCWQILCGGGWNDGKRPVGRAETNSSELRNCGKMSLPEKLAVKVQHEMQMCPRVGLLKNIATMDGWIELPGLKCLRKIWTGNIRVNYFSLGGPMTPPVIREEIQHPDGLVITAYPWTLYPRSSITVKHELGSSRPSKASVVW